MKDLEAEYQATKAELESLLAGERIYNQSSFKGLKERAHRHFSDELSEVLDHDTKKSGDTKMLWFVTTPYWHQLSSCIKKIKSDKSQGFTDDRKEYVLIVLYKWEAIAKQLEKAVALIVKGRKPGERKTLPRTLENTGTCPICGKNHKLDGAGKLVNHGYTVQYHQHNGWCFGVGKLPWEVSPQGAIDYTGECLIPHKSYVESSLKILVWSPKTLSRIAAELNMVVMQISYFEYRIAKWEKKELPRHQ